MTYFSLNEYCRKEFGCKLYKLSIDGGMTCPNRDGTVGTGGCIFCSDTGSGEFAEKPCGCIYEQLENAKKRVEHKNKGGKYIAYFQSFTNTYAPVKYLEKIFTEAINHPDVAVLSVATRPDCLDTDVLELLAKLNNIKPVWIELGLQTSNEKTAVFINRGYTNNIYTTAVKNLAERKIKVVTHIILGLPGEELCDMIETVNFALNCGTWGIKLQLLHVLKDTELANLYYEGKINIMEQDEYINTVCELLKHIPKNTVIHRLTGDGDKKKLIAPLWSANKKSVLNNLNKKLKNLIQD